MSATLGANWTKVQSIAGNVEIDTAFQWLGINGTTAGWGNNATYATNTWTRASGKTFIVDIAPDANDATLGHSLMVGLNSGNTTVASYCHGVLFGDISTGGAIKVFEDGNDRGQPGTHTWVRHATYRIKIVPSSGGTGATYSIQGGTMAALGSASWTDITPGTSSSAVNTFHPAAMAYQGKWWIGDPKAY